MAQICNCKRQHLAAVAVAKRRLPRCAAALRVCVRRRRCDFVYERLADQKVFEKPMSQLKSLLFYCNKTRNFSAPDQVLCYTRASRGRRVCRGGRRFAHRKKRTLRNVAASDQVPKRANCCCNARRIVSTRRIALHLPGAPTKTRTRISVAAFFIGCIRVLSVEVSIAGRLKQLNYAN